MPSDDRDLLDVLKFELQFVEKGGYGRSPRQPWRAPLIFEDSPTCLNFALPDKVCPCTDCVLMQLVPEGDRDKSIPCNYILLNEGGETVASLYRSAEQPEIERVIKEWLRKTIREIEQSREKGEAAASPQASVSSLNAAKCANPLCPKHFDAQAGGKFFVLKQSSEQGDQTQVKHYWLCHDCSQTFTLVEQAGRGPVLAMKWQQPSRAEADKPVAAGPAGKHTL